MLDRTTVISCFRLSELHQRFHASAEDRYVLSIVAVMCSVVEANLTIICANLPTLGYKVFFDRVRRNRYGGVYAEGLRRLTIGNGPDPVNVGRDIERDDISEDHRRYEVDDNAGHYRRYEIDDNTEHRRRDEDRDIDFSIFELPSRVPVQLPG